MKKILLIIMLFLSFELNNKASSLFINDADLNDIYSKKEMDILHDNLTEEVDKYIKNNSSSSKLSAEKLVNVCIEYEMDIVLALSQAHVESYFGTVGIASRTNSVFNVGTFDDGTILYIYEHPDYSIEPYVALITKRYLIDNKTVGDLLKPRSFVNYKGKRYATFKTYEYRLKEKYDIIVNETNIDEYQNMIKTDKYKKSKILYNYANTLDSILKCNYIATIEGE